MEKIVVRISLFRFGVQKFQDEVNALLDSGEWRLGECYITQPRVRLICYARLLKVDKKK